ncbi:MAG TPA: hypothetical protein VHE99_07390 [Gammaproteobacteria bacterium]|nr:hypothetical protein [Gammaproteobacteria bacterium]
MTKHRFETIPEETKKLHSSQDILHSLIKNTSSDTSIEEKPQGRSLFGKPNPHRKDQEKSPFAFPIDLNAAHRRNLKSIKTEYSRRKTFIEQRLTQDEISAPGLKFATYQQLAEERINTVKAKKKFDQSKLIQLRKLEANIDKIIELNQLFNHAKNAEAQQQLSESNFKDYAYLCERRVEELIYQNIRLTRPEIERFTLMSAAIEELQLDARIQKTSK